MQGILYVVEKLGQTLAGAEQELERAQKTIEVLQARLNELEAAAKPSKE